MTTIILSATVVCGFKLRDHRPARREALINKQMVRKMTILIPGKERKGSILILQRRIQAMEMRCYLKILHISYKDHVTNEDVCAKIQQALKPHKDLMIIKRCTLQWYDHVSC